MTTDIDPSGKTTQALVHVTSQGQLQIEGTLTEYDLATLKEGQAVKITSKVYPDKSWTGRISYISNYPNQTTATTTGTSTAASYTYRVDFTSDAQPLKQGFNVSVEVVNDKQTLLVPVTAIVSKGDKNYVWVYDSNNHRVLKKAVTLGDADAKWQEVATGLSKDQKVITNPTSSLKEGQRIATPENAQKG